MSPNVARQLIASHLVDGSMRPGEEIALRIDQTLTQDATGTLVMLELDAMGLDRVQTEVSAQYVDHNLLQEDNKNPDDHLFLYSACQRLGVWYSRAGGGVSHPVHQQRFGAPGKTLLGADSHTPAAGAMGMLAIGAGGIEVALAMSGQPFYTRMPKIWGVKLTGRLPDWVSAKDVILEMLRRHGVDGGLGCIIEHYGPGLDGLSAMDRHVIANMGAELGATTTVFPSDHEVRRYLRSQGREEDWIELVAGEEAEYDRHEEIELSRLEPLMALPTSPGNIERVSEVAGEDIYQAYIGSSANPGYRDFAVAAQIVKGRRVPDQVSFDVNPTSRQLLAELIRDGHLASLIEAGARLHQAGCNGCIGMGQAPATGKLSLRTVPRNFPGRSGARDDRVCLVSPETAAASALHGRVTDPRTLDMAYPRVREPDVSIVHGDWLAPPLPPDEARHVELVKGPGIVAIPELDELPPELNLTVLLKVGDGISTDEILPAGARVLPFRSNIPEISRFAFAAIDENYHGRALEIREQGGHAVVGGENYGQGSSREHAALAPRYLGLRVVLAKSFARIHRQNLVNFGVVPLLFDDPADYDAIGPDDRIHLRGLHDLSHGSALRVEINRDDHGFPVRLDLSPRQLEILQAGGLINWMKSHV